MSKPAFWWHGNVVAAIRQYPSLMEEREALGKLSDQEERTICAVRQAILELTANADGAEVLDVVDLYHWQRIGDFEVVGFRLHMSRSKAKRKNSCFVGAVARHLGYLRMMG